MSKPIHIVCLDAPAPPNYGGAIDMYYKVKALAKAGHDIHLHYFDYRNGRDAGDLADLCARVDRYPRHSFLRSQPFALPYIIGSRINDQLLRNLNANDHPVVLEGLHCAGILPRLRGRGRAILRMHNEEASYYAALQKMEHQFFKRYYYGREAALLSNYQKTMDPQTAIACLSTTDADALRTRYGFRNLHFIPCFIPWQSVQVLPGKGQYCLYHGNLAVSENEAAACWLVEEVFKGTGIPLLIAGSGATERLRRKLQGHPNCSLVENPPMDELNGIIRDAHIHVLPSLNTTGVKLKLLHALYNGRFCVVNSNGVAGSGLESFVEVANEPEAFTQKIKALWEQDFSENMITKRREIEGLYDNHYNALRLSALW